MALTKRVGLSSLLLLVNFGILMFLPPTLDTYFRVCNVIFLSSTAVPFMVHLCGVFLLMKGYVLHGEKPLENSGKFPQ